MKAISLYIHIPFCRQKCLYCDFNSITFKNPEQINFYLKALKSDIHKTLENNRGYKIKSIYFGGGTPSLLNGNDIQGIMEQIREYAPFQTGAEVTLEANPATIDYEKLLLCRQSGVTRISLGVQSFNDKYLQVLGRIHSRKDALASIDLLKKAGFDSFSIDLMYALPEQTLKQWHKDLDQFLALGIDHISFYDLKIEKSTPFYNIRKSLKTAGEDLQARMYTSGCEKLKEAGYIHYEISSFAKLGKQAQHNLIYWKNEEYFGVGAGAYSYEDGLRFGKQKNIKKYIKEAALSRISRHNSEKLSLAKRLVETLVLRLRILEEGANLSKIEKQCGRKFTGKLIQALEYLVQIGLIINKAGEYKLSHKGILCYDTVAAYLLA
ncbi:MAG: radical SAM family heme chaperone HemW [Candidatus Omnitrophota bacterium]